MATQPANRTTQPRRLLRSIGAVLLGFAVIVALSIGTDQVMHSLGIYPPWGEPMNDTGLLVLALAYRIVYAVVGSYVAAWFAPHSPMGHALALGVLGLVASTAGAIAMWDFSPNWFPITLVLIALPCAWLGGLLYRMRSTER